MATTCYLADQSDTTIRLFDFADVNGVNNLGGVKTKLVGIDPGSYQPELGLFAPDTGDGSFRTKRRAPSTTMTIQLRTTATSQDNHRKAMNRLFSLMEVPRVIVYQGEGMPEAFHIFTLGIMVEQLLRGGQSNWDLIVRQFEDVQMDLNIQRQPIILLATELSSATNVLANGIMIGDQGGANGAVDGTADSWAFRTTAGVLDTVGIAGQTTGGGADGQSFTITAGTTKDFTQEVVGGASVGDIFSGQFVFEADSGITAIVGVLFLNGAAPVGVATLSAPVIGNAKEQRLTAVSAAAGAGTDRARILLRIQNTSGVTKTVILRRAQLEEAAAATRFRVGTDAVPNDPALPRGRNRYFWNDGEATVPVKIVSVVDSVAPTAAVQWELRGKRSQMGVTGLRKMGDLQETRYAQTELSERGWTVTLGADTTNPGGAADADASGVTVANFVRTTHATAPGTSARRVRFTRTTKLDSLRGRYKVFGRFRPPTTPRQFGLTLKWSPSTVDPAIVSEPEVVLDTETRTGDATPTITQGWVEVELGSCELPLDPTVAVGGIALEVWSRVILPDPPTLATLDFDAIWLVPADAAGNEDSIGAVFITGSATQRTIGKDLTTPPLKLAADPVWVAGQLQGNVRRLRGVNQAAGLGANATGIVYGAGRHRVTFFVNDLLKQAHSVKIRVTNVTGAIEVPGAITTWTTKIPSQVVLEWTGVAATGYQPMIGILTYGSGTPGNAGYLDILSVVYDFIPVAAPTEAFRSDPGERYIAERLDASLNLMSILDASGEVPFFADRGLNFLSFREDEPALQFYLDRQNKKARVPTVSFAYRPGFYEL